MTILEICRVSLSQSAITFQHKNHYIEQYKKPNDFIVVFDKTAKKCISFKRNCHSKSVRAVIVQF